MSDQFGEFVQQRRRELGLTRQELATRAEKSYPYVSQLETGKRVPSLKTLHGLARALEMSVEDLAARMSTETWLRSETSLSSDLPADVAPSGSSAPAPRRQNDLDEYRTQLIPALQKHLRQAPPLVRVELLTQLLQEATQALRDGT